MSNGLFYYYLISFLTVPENKPWEVFNIAFGLSHKNVQRTVIEKAREKCGLSEKKAVVLSVSYLGHMTAQEFDEEQIVEFIE